MDGVAGHAGVFSSARDLAIFAQMFLDQGTYPGGRILSPMSIRAMTAPQSPANAADVRGYGWDLGSVYSSPRGDIFDGGYGHTGFTGTSLWIHPPTDSFVILLTNRVHPNGGKDINHLRGAVANIVAASVSDHAIDAKRRGIRIAAFRKSEIRNATTGNRSVHQSIGRFAGFRGISAGMGQGASTLETEMGSPGIIMTNDKAQILIVDDEVYIQEILKSTLEDSGYECVAVNSAESALEALASKNFDIALSDIRMPGKQGTELLQDIKKEYRRRRGAYAHGD